MPDLVAAARSAVPAVQWLPLAPLAPLAASSTAGQLTAAPETEI